MLVMFIYWKKSITKQQYVYAFNSIFLDFFYANCLHFNNNIKLNWRTRRISIQSKRSFQPKAIERVIQIIPIALFSENANHTIFPFGCLYWFSTVFHCYIRCYPDFFLYAFTLLFSFSFAYCTKIDYIICCWWWWWWCFFRCFCSSFLCIYSFSFNLFLQSNGM